MTDSEVVVVALGLVTEVVGAVVIEGHGLAVAVALHMAVVQVAPALEAILTMAAVTTLEGHLEEATTEPLHPAIVEA